MKYAVYALEWRRSSLPKGIEWNDRTNSFFIREHLIEDIGMREKVLKVKKSGVQIYNVLASYTDDNGNPLVFRVWYPMGVFEKFEYAQGFGMKSCMKREFFQIKEFDDTTPVGEIFREFHDYDFIE